MATYWENSCSFGLRYVSWYKYMIVSLVFSHLGFWSGNLFLIAPFRDLCLLVPFHNFYKEGFIQSKIVVTLLQVFLNLFPCVFFLLCDAAMLISKPSHFNFGRRQGWMSICIARPSQNTISNLLTTAVKATRSLSKLHNRMYGQYKKFSV